jgi:hypothetical protein
MKTWAGLALGLLCPALLGAQAGAKGAATRTGSSRAADAPPLTAADSDRVVVARLATEARERVALMNQLRTNYVQRGAWAELGDRCTPGALRIFPRDTTAGARDTLQAMVERMERYVISGGAGGSLATPEARSLLRTIVGWEAGIDRPNWDVLPGQKTRQAFATGLTGDVPDPNGPGCLPSAVVADTVTFVIPGFTDMEFPKAPRPRVKAYFGPEGQTRVRDEFFTAIGSRDNTAELLYVLVAPMVIWNDYGLVAVRRPQELGGVQVSGSNRGGATYLMRRVGAEWRLLAVVRSWGG